MKPALNDGLCAAHHLIERVIERVIERPRAHRIRRVLQSAFLHPAADSTWRPASGAHIALAWRLNEADAEAGAPRRFAMSRRLVLRPALFADLHWPALDTLGAASWPEAREMAQRVLGRGPHCLCCVSARVHLARYVGSTLFFDDDPEELRQALPPGEQLGAREIAACIVLHGRERVDLFLKR